MLRNSRREWMSLGFSLSFALALGACTVKIPDDGLLGSGGTQAMLVPVSGATGGAPAAAAMTGSGGMTTSAAGSPAPAAGEGQPPAGTGGAAPMGTGGQVASGDAGLVPVDGGMLKTTAHEDLGKGDGTDVITIGDSWMSIFTNGGGIEGGLDRAGTAYRHYSVAGTLLLNGQIPGQYDQAKASNPKILTVVMTGGGNDIMFSNGCATKESCTMAVQQLADGLNTLWTEMADDGVKDVVYISYSKNAGTAPSDTRPDTSPIPPICVSGKITCHTVDTTMEVGPTDTVDGIHPTLAACDLIAAKVLALMEKEGMRR